MTYTADKPRLTPPVEELRARIPGWGADLNPADRPSVPREKFDPSLSGAHWVFPERQKETWPRERSVEHEFSTPVFGTSCPPRGLSGLMRKRAYAKYSEARAAHWLLLLAADRVDAIEAHVRSFGTARPDNPVTQTGVLSEFRHSPVASRFGQNRVDTKHMGLDPIIVAGPWVAAGVGAWRGLRKLRRR